VPSSVRAAAGPPREERSSEAPALVSVPDTMPRAVAGGRGWGVDMAPSRDRPRVSRPGGPVAVKAVSRCGTMPGPAGSGVAQ
jgi:hypothetical protein